MKEGGRRGEVGRGSSLPRMGEARRFPLLSSLSLYRLRGEEEGGEGREEIVFPISLWSPVSAAPSLTKRKEKEKGKRKRSRFGPSCKIIFRHFELLS